MAYSDSIRDTATTANEIADLIDGVISSTGPLVWTTFSPTYGNGVTKYNTVTTYFAKYAYLSAKAMFIDLAATGTTATTASPYIDITIPATIANLAASQMMPCLIKDTTYKLSVTQALLNTTSIRVFANQDTTTNWALGAGREIYVRGLIQLA